MGRQRRRQATETKKGWGAGQVLLAAALLLTLVFFFRSGTGLRHGLLGSYVWATAFILTFLIALERTARFLLPAEITNSHLEAYTLLLRYAVYVMLPQGLRQLVGIKGFPSAPKQVSESFARLGVGFVDSHYCLALVRGGNYSRATGPGYVKLNPGEMIRHVIDLRPHIRTLPVRAVTKDGINIETRVTVVFRVRQNPNEWLDATGEPDRRYMFPYMHNAIFGISYASGIREDEQELFWTERVAPVAAAVLITELARLSLNELYQSGDANVVPLEQLNKTTRTVLLDHLEPIFGFEGEENCPIEIMGISIDPPLPPLDVVKQRIENWQINWQRRIYLEQVAGDAEAIRQTKMARARAQLELIENIIQNVDLMRRDTDLKLSDIVTLRVLETLEQVSKVDSVHMLIPNRVMSTMSQVKAVLSDYDEEPDNSNYPVPTTGGPPRRVRN